MASKNLLETIKSQSVMVTIDGPRGPRYEFKPALVKLAAKAGLPIIPIAATCKGELTQFKKSWDHFVAPFFFSPMQVAFGPPIYVDAQVTEDAECLDTERSRLNQLTQKWSADLDKNHGSVEFLLND